jgi:hypothetical protein
VHLCFPVPAFAGTQGKVTLSHNAMGLTRFPTIMREADGVVALLRIAL